MASAGNQQHPQPGKHVLIIVENLPVPFDRRVWLEALALKEAGYMVSVICPKMKGFVKNRETLQGIEIYRHPLPYEAVNGAVGFLIEYVTALFFELLLATRIFLTHRFSAIHACNPPDTIFLIGRVFKLLGVKFLFDQHDINPELYIAKYGKKDFFYKLLLALEKRTYKAADVVISTNNSYRDIALTRGFKKSEDVFVVRSAPDTTRFHQVPEDITLKNSRPYLVAYLGVMGKQEGLDLLLESIRYLVHDLHRKDITFILVGGGPELSSLRQLCTKLAIDNYVTFTGRISDEDLLTCLSTADVCVNPDRVNEMNDKSTMNKIMEYMALSRPIVQFQMTEGQYSAGKSSLYALPNDPHDFALKIIQLLDDAPLRLKMGQLGRMRLRDHFDWEHSKVALLKAYERLLAQEPF